MNVTITHRYAVCAILITGLVGIEIGVTKTTTFSQHPLPLTIGILFDCTVTATTIFYGLISRPLRLPISRTVLSEGRVIYYALFNWRGAIDVPVDAVPVTTHRESGQVALLIGLLGAGLIEASAMHFMLARWWPTASLWVTLASIYGCLILLAIINTIRKRPSFRTETALHLRLDLRWQAVIARDNIASITPIFEKPAKKPGLLNAALGMSPNILITLREPVQITGIYGISRTATQISLFVDEKNEFLKEFVGFAK